MARLVERHRISLRADQLIVAAMPFHPSGSANYSPAGVYIGLFREPDLGRVLGHEASHLSWSAALGADWRAHPKAGRVSAMAEAKDVDIEETMCLLMQTILSQETGVQPMEYRVSSALELGPQRDLLVELEKNWATYIIDVERWPTLIEYVLDQAETALA